MRGKAYRNNKISFGEYALQSQEPGWITSRQIEATRRTITRSIKRGGKLWITIFPDKPVTARAAESRMGSGKGAVDYWVAVIKPGAILFEINGLEKENAYKVLKLASYKLPIKTKIVSR
jgi:large subunit ribosomal protein L16